MAVPFPDNLDDQEDVEPVKYVDISKFNAGGTHSACASWATTARSVPGRSRRRPVVIEEEDEADE